VGSRKVRPCTPSALHATVRGWVNHVRYANSLGLRKAVLARHGSRFEIASSLSAKKAHIA
ncbi:MAG TPA: hypothetical protein P5333_20785, partial [Caldilinea sp.]|nr:hypothetical protein [Caldilinea sp.]